MEKIRCVIVDDEPIARRGMRRLIEMHPDLEAVGWASSAAEAERIIYENGVDLLFMDIDMPGESGLELARRIGKRVMVVFTTAYSDYALESYEVEAIDYLLKPIRAERFSKAVARALERAGGRDAGAVTPVSTVITVKADRRFERVATGNILFIEGLGDYLLIHLPDRRLTTRMTFKAMLDLLPAENFIRVNKSYIVNKAHIDSYNAAAIRIADTEIPIGGLYREEAKRMLQD